MSICASGASTTKPGVPAALVVDAAYVQSILPPLAAWTYPYLPWMRALEIGDVGSFCAGDPPSFTLPSAPDLYNFVTGGPAGQVQVVNTFLQNLARYYIWYSLCKCSSGATPAPAAAPAAPANLPQINPSSVVTPLNPASCANASTSPLQSSIPAGPAQYNSYDWTGLGGTSSITRWVGSLTNPTTLAIQVTHTLVDPGPHENGTLTVRWYNGHVGGLTTLFDNTFPVSAGTSASYVLPIPSASNYAAILWTAPHSTTDTLSVVSQIYCGGTPGSLSGQGCCPPDPMVLATLKQVLDTVTLIQRQAVPFAYIVGLVHSGLSGHGVIAVSGLLGMKIDITTIPPSLGRTGTTPEEVFDLGWLTWGTPDGYPSSFRLEHHPQVSMPSRCSGYTTFAYDLAPGVVITLSELIREP